MYTLHVMCMYPLSLSSINVHVVYMSLSLVIISVAVLMHVLDPLALMHYMGFKCCNSCLLFRQLLYSFSVTCHTIHVHYMGQVMNIHCVLQKWLQICLLLPIRKPAFEEVRFL